MAKQIILSSILLAVTALGRPLNETQSLKWRPCQNISTQSNFSYDCSTLQVPLDYSNPSNGSIELQLLRLLAPQQPSQGSIHLNFGGPGIASGDMIVAVAPLLVPSTGGVYDLVTFDPRGTGDTITFNCSDTLLGVNDLGNRFTASNSSDTAIGQNWAQAGKLADQCLTVERDIGTHLGTAAVARDLMSVVDALNEDGLLRYWGLSYGTTLGATVAAMFPDRVGRMILDGVQNVHEYYNATALVQQWTDADETFSGLWSTCIAAGPELCALARGFNDLKTLENAVWNLMWSLKFSPVTIGENSTFIMDYTGMKTLFIQSISATAYWPATALIVDKLLDGETGDDVLELVAAISPIDPVGSIPLSLVTLANAGIQCADRSPSVRVDNLTQLIPKLQPMHEVSRLMGDVLDSSTFTCNRWKFDAEDRFEGNWENIETLNPLLFIGNTYDPRTPLLSAYNMSASFPGSVVLEVNGYGHASLGLQSNCTTATTAAYFVNGTLPKVGTICPVDLQPFEVA